MTIYRRARSKYWYIRFSRRGQQIHESTRSTSGRQAQQIEEGRRAMLARGETRTSLVTFPLTEELIRRP